MRRRSPGTTEHVFSGVKERAVRPVLTQQAAHHSEGAAIQSIAGQRGGTAETRRPTRPRVHEHAAGGRDHRAARRARATRLPGDAADSVVGRRSRGRRAVARLRVRRRRERRGLPPHRRLARRHDVAVGSRALRSSRPCVRVQSATASSRAIAACTASPSIPRSATVIRRRGPWRHGETLALATLAGGDWCNTRRGLEPIGSVPPRDYADASSRHPQPVATPSMGAGVMSPRLRRTRGGSDRPAVRGGGRGGGNRAQGAAQKQVDAAPGGGRVGEPHPARRPRSARAHREPARHDGRPRVVGRAGDQRQCGQGAGRRHAAGATASARQGCPSEFQERLGLTPGLVRV